MENASIIQCGYHKEVVKLCYSKDHKLEHEEKERLTALNIFRLRVVHNPILHIRLQPVGHNRLIPRPKSIEATVTTEKSNQTKRWQHLTI